MSRSCQPRTRKRCIAVCLVALALLLGLSSGLSPAQTSMQLTHWREFSYSKDVREIGGLMTSLKAIQRSGFIVLGDGEFARLSGWIIYTIVGDGKEFYQGLTMYDFQDGSTILAKVDAAGETNAKKTGTIVFLAGTGRFQGIVGRGTVSAWMPKPWDMYTEVDASFSAERN
jgi:hypothetical protein